MENRIDATRKKSGLNSRTLIVTSSHIFLFTRTPLRTVRVGQMLLRSSSQDKKAQFEVEQMRTFFMVIFTTQDLLSLHYNHSPLPHNGPLFRRK